MTRPSALLFWAVLIVVAGVLVNLGGCGGGGSQSSPAASKIEHVVIIFQENRTPDNLFQDPMLVSRGADIASSGLNSKGENIPLTTVPLASVYDPRHRHPDFLAMYDGGKMDGADLIPINCPPNQPDCAPANPQFKFIDPGEVGPYFQLAEQYTFGDRMFQTNQGPSFPAHQFIISGTSAPTASSDLFAAENTRESGNPLPPGGCTVPADVSVPLIDPTGDESQSQYPCFEHPTLMDLLDQKNLSWRYYTLSDTSIWTAPNAIKHLRMGPDWAKNVVLNPPQVLTDIASGNLAAVTWVIPKGQSSDHAMTNDGSGPSWVASVVNAIGNSPFWSNTAIIIAWDDWGGWYDHVPPKIINSYEYGFRVPLIVVSPYAKPGYISHVTHDFGSILRFIEQNFGLPSLGYADSLSDDLSDCFDFNQTPLKFQSIAAPLDAAYFINDTRPATDPDTD